MRHVSIRVVAALALLGLIIGGTAVILVRRAAPITYTTREPIITAPGSDCAAKVVKTPEHQPQNARLNSYVPQPNEHGTLPDYFGPELQREFQQKVDGAFTGTTDEIFQFYACKYGIDVDLVRAAAWTETSHNALMNGDNGESWGIMQVRDSPKSHAHAHPAARLSTSYNVDYWAFHLRSCIDGKIAYLKETSQTDVWGCVGLWYYGADTRHPKSEEYIARVQRNFREQPWRREYEPLTHAAAR